MRLPRPRLRVRLRTRELAITLGVVAGVCAFAMLGAWLAPGARPIPREAPGLVWSAMLSIGRMATAFLISLVFALLYGLTAATRPQTRSYLLPLLDIGQSVPIPALFPVVVVVFIETTGTLFGSPRLGVELACIFLIFSVQVWNLAFGVYEAITQIPADLRQAADSMGLLGLRRFFHLYLPACWPKIIYNSIASWANGWYFLTLCEVLDEKHRVDGIGAFLADAINPRFQVFRFTAGLALIFAIVFAMEFFLWRPLTAWSRKFGHDTIVDYEEDGDSFVFDWWRRSRAAAQVRSIFRSLRWRSSRISRRFTRRFEALKPQLVSRILPRVARVSYFGFFAIVALLTISGIVALVMSLVKPWPPSAASVPLALLSSAARIASAYLLTLCWTVPLALWVARNPRYDRYVTPVAEILAAIPAVAVWPLLARVFQPFFGTNVTAVVMLMTGMQWYLLFNLIEGVKRLPGDLSLASRSLGLRGFTRIRHLYFPIMMPAVVTGSVTAWGGGWNALIVAERFTVGSETHECDGIGSRLMHSTGENLDSVSLALNVLAMLVAVVILNRIVWHRLYNYAESRFRLDG